MLLAHTEFILSLFQSEKGDQTQNFFTPRASVGAEAAVEPFMIHIFRQH